jgi:16S rRNA (guanine966-N2)-methyltransferase
MDTVKITSGNLRGRTLLTPGGNTHPMGAREKLALFNMISSYLKDATVLDAYAGSGALGIEAISRGASKVIFIEKNAKAAQIIRQNLANLCLKADVFQGAVENFQSKARFDIILADPPYDHFNPEAINQLTPFLKNDGVLVLSHPNQAPEIPGLSLLKSNRYAGAHLSLYIKH